MRTRDISLFDHSFEPEKEKERKRSRKEKFDLREKKGKM